jgi:excinuclease UvrABC nuclease subunit
MLKDLHRCDAVCDGTQTPDAYAAVVEQAREAMRDPSPLLDGLAVRMRAHASDGDFERATECREQRRHPKEGHDHAIEHSEQNTKTDGEQHGAGAVRVHVRRQHGQRRGQD